MLLRSAVAGAQPEGSDFSPPQRKRVFLDRGPLMSIDRSVPPRACARRLFRRYLSAVGKCSVMIGKLVTRNNKG